MHQGPGQQGKDRHGGCVDCEFFSLANADDKQGGMAPIMNDEDADNDSHCSCYLLFSLSIITVEP